MIESLLQDRLACIVPVLRQELAAAIMDTTPNICHADIFRRNVASHPRLASALLKISELTLSQLRAAQRGLRARNCCEGSWALLEAKLTARLDALEARASDELSVSRLTTTLETDERDTVRPSASAGHGVSSMGCTDAWYIGESADAAVQTSCVDPKALDAYIQASAGVNDASTQTVALTMSVVESEAKPALSSSFGTTDIVRTSPKHAFLHGPGGRT